MNELWIALNQEGVSRDLSDRTYTHIAFTIDKEDLELLEIKLKSLDVEVLPGRVRGERDKNSNYFLDPDGHMFEFHTGTLQDRLDYYKEEKDYIIFYK